MRKVRINYESRLRQKGRLTWNKLEVLMRDLCNMVKGKQNAFSTNDFMDIVCNADMRVGEIRQFCKLQEEGQSHLLVATSR